MRIRRRRSYLAAPALVAGCEVARDRIELSTSRFSGGRSYRLSYLALPLLCRTAARALLRSRRDSNPRPPP